MVSTVSRNTEKYTNNHFDDHNQPHAQILPNVLFLCNSYNVVHYRDKTVCLMVDAFEAEKKPTDDVATYKHYFRTWYKLKLFRQQTQ